MPKNLDNLVKTIAEAFQGLDRIKDSDVVLTLGLTGSGKSTLLTSLIFGPDMLEVKKTNHGKIVIEQKHGQKSQGHLQIGHSLGKSCTFCPEIIYFQEHNSFYIDVAGFMDCGGEFFDLLNSFIIKYLF